jgi:hypothetical protein
MQMPSVKRNVLPDSTESDSALEEAGSSPDSGDSGDDISGIATKHGGHSCAMFLWPFTLFSIADSTSSRLRIVLASDRQSIRRGVQTKSVGKSVQCESMLE